MGVGMEETAQLSRTMANSMPSVFFLTEWTIIMLTITVGKSNINEVFSAFSIAMFTGG